jgi:basic amino acid/polyamine antiporter, APA family
MNDYQEHSSTQLRRQLGLAALVFYGVGDILGAGIYALVGEVAGMAGRLSWLSFLIALIVASFTGLTYAELGGRFPRSGGESHFCRQAFRQPWIAKLIGWLVFTSGVLSLATVSRAFAGYLHILIPDVSAQVMVVSLLLLLAAINFLGINVSSAANIVCTLIESSGLLIVVCAGLAFIAEARPSMASEATFSISGDVPGMFAVFQAASLAFFAFIGFEDMVNVAEEARNPGRDMPRAIILAASIAGILYIIVVLVATRVLSPQELATSDAPLLRVVQVAAPSIPTWLFTTIALFAVANTGLLNFITASRLLYGMSQDGLLPKILGNVHEGRGTPHGAIGVVLVTAISLATTGTLAYLAGTTSVLLLIVFLTMNVVLIRLKRNHQLEKNAFSVPIALPICGVCVCALLLACTPLKALLTAGILLAIGALLILIEHRRSASA